MISGTENKAKSPLLWAIILRLPAPLIVVTLWVLSSQSKLPEMKGIFGFDKFLHFAAFAALSFTAGLWFSRESWLKLPWRNFLICLTVVSAYGALDEFHQYFVPGRDSSVWDWVADTLGGAAGAVVVLLAARFTSKYGFNRITCGY